MKIVLDSIPHPDGEPRWTPNTDVVVYDSGEMLVTLELAGLTREDLELAIDGSRLRVRGYRRNEENEAVGSYFVMEIANGPFEVVYEIPPHYDLCQARAAYEAGFLRIQIPPKRET
jgi:HSP20 family protein